MNKKFKKLFALLCALMMMSTLGLVFASAADGDTNVAVSAMQEALGEVTSTISIGNVVTVLVTVIGICIGLVFFWWGLRKIIRMVMTAFRKGNISV